MKTVLLTILIFLIAAAAMGQPPDPLPPISTDDKYFLDGLAGIVSGGLFSYMLGKNI